MGGWGGGLRSYLLKHYFLKSLNYLSVFIHKTQTNIELALRARFRDASAVPRRKTVGTAMDIVHLRFFYC